MNIYIEAKNAGIEMDHHCSDLYLPVNKDTKALIDSYEFKQNVTNFISNIDGSLWFDIPFAFEPFWEDAEKQVELWAINKH